MDQIDCYKNVNTKLTVTPKYRDQNSGFAMINFPQHLEVFSFVN